MTIIELSAVVLAVSGLATAVSAVIAMAYLLPVVRDAGNFLREANESLNRINRVTEEAEGVVRRVRNVESRLSSTIGTMLDHVGPPVRWFGALSTAVKIGSAAFRRRPQKNTNSNPKLSSKEAVGKEHAHE